MPAGADARKAPRRGSDEGGTLAVGGGGGGDELQKKKKRAERGEERGTNGTARPQEGAHFLHATQRASM